MALRVLMIAPRFLPAVGGVETHIEMVVKDLVDRGHTVTVLAPSHTPNLPTIESGNHFAINRMPYGLDRNPLMAQLWTLRHLPMLLNHDIIHYHDTYPLLAWGLPIVAARRGQVFATFHGFETDPIQPHWRFMRKLARRVVKRCICAGRFIENQYGIKCNGITYGATEERSPAEHDTYGSIFVGRLEADTGILEHLRALVILKDQYGKRLPLVICGSGSLSHEVRVFTEREDIEVSMKGRVDNPIEYMRQARVCLAAGYLVMLESMSLGLPTIGVAQSPLKMDYLKSIHDAGAPISIQTSPEGVARELNRVLSSPSLQKRIRYEGIRFARERTWSALTDEYLKLWGIE